MDRELIDRAARLLADLEVGTADDAAVDWSVSPPEGGTDSGYALGTWLLTATLDEPRLAPLAEGLTRPAPDARPAPEERAQLLTDDRWRGPFAIVCDRLLTLGPWEDRALQIAVALRSLDDPTVATTILPTLFDFAETENTTSELLISRLELLDPGNPRSERLRQRLGPQPRLLVFADELCASPELLDRFLGRFGDDPGAALLVYAPGWTAAQAAERIGAIVQAAGAAAATAEVTALTVEPTAENDSAVARSVTVLISNREHNGPFAALARMG